MIIHIYTLVVYVQAVLNPSRRNFEKKILLNYIVLWWSSLMLTNIKIIVVDDISKNILRWNWSKLNTTATNIWVQKRLVILGPTCEFRIDRLYWDQHWVHNRQVTFAMIFNTRTTFYICYYTESYWKRAPSGSHLGNLIQAETMFVGEHLIIIHVQCDYSQFLVSKMIFYFPVVFHVKLCLLVDI
jgi:hypothetical protein